MVLKKVFPFINFFLEGVGTWCLTFCKSIGVIIGNVRVMMIRVRVGIRIVPLL